MNDAFLCFDFLVNGRGTFDARTHKFIFITPEINCFAVFVVVFLLRVAGCHRSCILHRPLWMCECYSIVRTFSLSTHAHRSIHLRCNRIQSDKRFADSIWLNFVRRLCVIVQHDFNRTVYSIFRFRLKRNCLAIIGLRAFFVLLIRDLCRIYCVQTTKTMYADSSRIKMNSCICLPPL